MSKVLHIFYYKKAAMVNVSLALFYFLLNAAKIQKSTYILFGN